MTKKISKRPKPITNIPITNIQLDKYSRYEYERNDQGNWQRVYEPTGFWERLLTGKKTRPKLKR